ncbi:MAG: acetylglutamate kinase [Candidatus Omnitrophica bacterium]|jgi:acetylglutamate kinase|nr:acetylglutamate kinase [Candidatus Omnitrophota bacterium]
MEKYIAKADVMIEALPYIQSFFEKIVVIKYGGSAMLDPVIRKDMLQDIVFMSFVGMRPVLVHGGGPFINKKLEAKGKKAIFANGIRVTDEDTMEVVDEALSEVNRDIVRELISLGGSAISLSGKDDHLIMTRKHAEVDGVDMGYVGDVTDCNVAILEKLVTSDIIPVISPIGVGKDGFAYNVNADTAAAEIARELKALKFVLLTDKDGILADVKDPSTLISQVKYAEAEELFQKGIIGGGMIPKVRACLRAMDRGVKKAHIINGMVPHALLLEIFTDKGIGTEIVKR